MCYSLWYNAPATSPVHYTTSCNTHSSAPEDGRDQRLKHVELIGIIDKPLLLLLVGVYITHTHSAVAFTEIYDTFLRKTEESIAFIAPSPIQTVDTAL